MKSVVFKDKVQAVPPIMVRIGPNSDFFEKRGPKKIWIACPKSDFVI